MKQSASSSKPSCKTALKAGETVRLNRYLADCGLGSRRKVEEIITAGRIKVNGSICTDLSCQIDPGTDSVEADGQALSVITKKMYLILNKPRGYVVSQSDELGRQTVYELLPENAAGMPYAGRLDKNSEGLLLFTNDTGLINQLTHPSHKVEKVYKVDIDRPLKHKELELLRSGVEIEGGITLPAGVYVKHESEKSCTLKIVITEGRKRQIRQMIEAVGAKVRSLKRVQFGPIHLNDLPTGRWRMLEMMEVRALFSEKTKGLSSKQSNKIRKAISDPAKPQIRKEK